MNRFLVQLSLFIILPLPLFLLLEASSRKNSFATKAAYVKAHSNEIEVLILGSSHTWRAINPDLLDVSVAPLAHGGSAFNIDVLLFRKFQPAFRQLRVVILEASVHSLEEYRQPSWNKNHLFFVHYGLENYGAGRPPLKDHALVSAAPIQHLRRAISSLRGTGLGTLNEWGFVTTVNESRFASLNFDTQRIADTSMRAWLKGRHDREDVTAYERNVRSLEEVVDACRKARIKLILLSPPKYHLYNEHMPVAKRQRRAQAVERFSDEETVFFWDDESWQDQNAELYLNEDHLNPRGARKYTEELNRRLGQMLDGARPVADDGEM